ncbi:family 1 glycosylhydrolase [Paracoccus aurantiacus]|uniref:Family 1 glycosylhydrolase n=1 Tax=Paracoccus aurantiacus TaxID=2599412 RepID=A0A5C6S132_9RHOB|nr:family 1 glycosylhydrolase [Paracoccus aurantiacus]TXB67719.1 family 1 glycosylhydrolase [Paracoccus aurantiacus]
MAVSKVTPGQLGMATPFGELLGSSNAEMQAELADYAKLGVDWVRLDIHWDLVQPKANGSYNWTLVDRVFNAIDAAGMEVVAVLNNVPSWLDDTLSDAASQKALADFAKAAAQRYGDKVNYWEILNEQNKHGVDPADYTAALKQTYTAIKSVDADDTVITGGLAAVPSTGNGMWGAVDYLKQIYANGGGDYFDAVGYHPYTYPLTPKNNASWNGWEIMETGIRGTMVANGDSDKQVWMTEMGAPTWGNKVTVTEAEQAQILSEAVELAKSYDWAGPIMWFSYQDSALDTGFGLLDSSGNQKLAYSTFRTLGNQDNDVSSVSAQPIVVDIIGTMNGETLNGTDDDNRIDGKGGNDYLRGHGGNDTLFGGAGDDQIGGGAGNDKIYGGAGNDALAGGDGADTFIFEGNVGYDRITDFDQSENDLLDISSFDANSHVAGNQSFTFIGGSYLSKAGQVGVYIDKSNGYTYVQGDTNGDGKYDFSIRLNGVYNITADDLIL